jgi:hypothetical protein
MGFVEFVDRIRMTFGLVFGPGSDYQLPERLGLWEGTGAAHRHLEVNQDMLRKRLVRAGLAREYSDGHTELIPQ